MREDKRPGLISPPTDRVVAIIRLLAAEVEPVSVATIASQLGLNRTTVSAILGSLEQAGWAARLPDRRYFIGAGLAGLAETLREQLPLLDGGDEALKRLRARAGYGAALTHVGVAQSTIVAIARGGGGIPASVGVGTRMRLSPPRCAVVIAYRDERTQQAWIDAAPEESRTELADQLEQIRRSGIAVYGLGNTDPRVLGMLGEIVGVLAEQPTSGELRQRAFELMAGLSGNPYTEAELAASEPLGISHLAAPILDHTNQVTYELQLGPMSPGLTKPERDHLIDELITTAEQLGRPDPRTDT